MQLLRGEKLTELLKQPQYQPMEMEDQVAILYGATNGYVNDVPTPRTARVGQGLHRLPASEVRRRRRKPSSPKRPTLRRHEEALNEVAHGVQ